MDESIPIAIFFAHCWHAGTPPVKLGQSRPSPKAVAQGCVFVLCALAIQGLEKFDQLQIVVDEATFRQLQLIRFCFTCEIR
ncbi:hypothetical protein [Janthinobacterium aquaticum]|uniref:hypothetical protein n=1 Tax=Janthinobacterium sp. FT58W TaxID=2654254 RepID=UPI001D00288A